MLEDPLLTSRCDARNRPLICRLLLIICIVRLVSSFSLLSHTTIYNYSNPEHVRQEVLEQRREAILLRE